MNNQKRYKKRYKKKRKVVASVVKRELLIECAYIPITKVDFRSSHWFSSFHTEVDESFYSGNDILINDANTLTCFNISKYKNLVTVYNSFMYKVCYITYRDYNSSEINYYVVYNKFRLSVYHRNDFIDTIITELRNTEYKYKAKKNIKTRNHHKAFSRSNKRISRKPLNW